MVDVLNEIDFLQNVLITMREGASDEKRMMMDAIEKRIKVKEDMVADFEGRDERRHCSNGKWSQGMVTQEVKDFMNAVWDQEVIEGEKVIDKHLGFGGEPDIKFITRRQTVTQDGGAAPRR